MINGKKQNRFGPRSVFGSGISSFALFFVLISAGLTVNVRCQNKLPKGVVPPPLALISEDERNALDDETKLLNRTKVALKLMDVRLEKAEEKTNESEYQKSLDNLGSFKAILRDTLVYLKKHENSKGAIKSFKYFEISLRKTVPRIELIRRATPYKYSYHVRELLKNIKDAREKAIEPLFDDTVIPEGNRK